MYASVLCCILYVFEEDQTDQSQNLLIQYFLILPEETYSTSSSSNT